MSRDTWLAIANEAARDPSRAGRLNAFLLDLVREAKKNGGDATPPGYLYSAAHQWVVRVRGLDPEPLPTAAFPGRTPITASALDAVPLRTPFTALIIGVCGWALPQASPDAQGVVDVGQQIVSQFLSTAGAGRDLFSVSFGLDGQVTFGTDGRDVRMFPASTVVGTRLVPRQMAWTVRRNQTIQVKFRNITNVPLEDTTALQTTPIRLAEAAVNFFALNLERP
jgi:hypothetical protein